MASAKSAYQYHVTEVRGIGRSGLTHQTCLDVAGWKWVGVWQKNNGLESHDRTGELLCFSSVTAPTKRRLTGNGRWNWGWHGNRSKSERTEKLATGPCRPIAMKRGDWCVGLNGLKMEKTEEERG